MTDVAAPQARRRPVAVRVAAVLLAGMGLAGLGYGLAAVLVLPGVLVRLRTSGAGDAATVAAWLSGVLPVVLGLLLAGVLGAVAVGLWQGRPAARVAAWVVAGLGVLCGAASALVTAVAPGHSVYPAAWVWLTAVLSSGQAIGYGIAAVLLISGSGEFFRRGGAPGAPLPPVPPGPGWAPQPR